MYWYLSRSWFAGLWGSRMVVLCGAMWLWGRGAAGLWDCEVVGWGRRGGGDWTVGLGWLWGRNHPVAVPFLALRAVRLWVFLRFYCVCLVNGSVLGIPICDPHCFCLVQLQNLCPEAFSRATVTASSITGIFRWAFPKPQGWAGFRLPGGMGASIQPSQFKKGSIDGPPKILPRLTPGL